MTSPSTTPAASAADWLDRENTHDRQHNLHIPRVKQDSNAQLMRLRRQQMERRLEALRACGRRPRVGLYALAVNGQSPERSLTQVREFAVQMGWKVGREQTFTDRFGATAPEDRTGWLEMKRQIKSGFADGVVALTWSVISPQLDEYETELDWFSGQFGFVALVHAENLVPA